MATDFAVSLRRFLTSYLAGPTAEDDRTGPGRAGMAALAVPVAARP